ncbi:MAG: SDR family oxidoreductase [Balneolaceae bacterium]|nr:SDR family oxidoreductase [Balneolaceae bacterium]
MENKVALITGAASGIGRATALLFARNGALTCIADRSADGLHETLEMVQQFHSDAIAIQTDISSRSEVEAMVRRAADRFGRLEIACNNAGIEGEQSLTAECSEENWHRVININLRGTWLCMKYEIREMLKNGGGTIVNISSIAGLLGFPGIVPYVSSKHGINGMTKTAALEYAGQGIRVNSICPGAIQTPMIDRFVGGQTEERENLIGMHPMGRVGNPEEVAEAVLWLCSDKSSFVTGQSLVVDGGYTIR